MTEDEFLSELGAPRDIIDVRSEAEFACDHVPGAINLPVLNNAERAEIGTIYKRVSRFEARRKGAAMAARNIARHIETTLADRGGDFAPLVYCWRGGMRSGAMAHVLHQVGWRADTLEGGYRTYRRAVVRQLYETELKLQIIVLAGKTGCAKTEMLGRLRSRGIQVLDLEALANHRGSLFGSISESDQPGQKWFESLLFRELTALDPDRPVFIEDESSKIGRLIIPPALWKVMCVAPRVRLESNTRARAGYLCRTYSDIIDDTPRLREILDHLVKACGKEQVAAWHSLVDRSEFALLAEELVVRHYDPAYARSMARQSNGTLKVQPLGSMTESDLEQAADELVSLLHRAAEPKLAKSG